MFLTLAVCLGDVSDTMKGISDADDDDDDCCDDAALRLDSAEMAFSLAIDSASLLAISASNFFLFRSLSWSVSLLLSLSFASVTLR